jgi:hypothetical protein
VIQTGLEQPTTRPSRIARRKNQRDAAAPGQSQDVHGLGADAGDIA